MPGPFYFAWAGGAIEAQVTVVTNGNTHGAIFDTVAIVGDIAAGHLQLTNLASAQGLEAGVFYQLAGDGIAEGTVFVYDNTDLSGLPDSINLSLAATATLTSATFTATKSVDVAVALGTLVTGSSTVSLSDMGDLPGADYGVFGTGIGQTTVPVGTSTGTTYTSGGNLLILASCLLHYDGSSSGRLAILGATPHTTTRIDQFGQTTSQTTYAVAEQPVTATSSGQYPLQLSGFPVADRASITDIPVGALTDLIPGLRYNISGSGIPIGATFIAPTSGTSIELDMLATSSEVAAILTITGPRTPNATFDPAIHNRFDEEIVSLDISQDEGSFATLSVRLKNPDVGLLATGRNLWCWLSWDQAWPDGTPDLLPLFNGRLIGAPKLQAGEIVEVQFLARPDDFAVQKALVATDLQVAPYYDPIWLAGNLTPDTVLETYSALWHIDRTTLDVTTSDILEGEDGTIVIGESDAIYEKFSLAYGQPPLVATTVSGTVTWQQQAEGTLDVTQKLVRAFYDAGSGYRTVFATTAWGSGGGGLIQCLCGDGLKSDWPAPGTSVGGGWTLSTKIDHSGYPLCYIQDAQVSGRGGWLTPLYFNVSYAGQEPTKDKSNVNVYLNPFGQYQARFPINVYKIRMNLEYKADRTRTETVTAVLTAAVQRELSDSAENDRESITMSSDYVAKGVDPGGELPIGNVAYRSYFQSARGATSLEYLLLAARAKMRARARAVDITFGTGWLTALGINLRNSVTLYDRRLPGGVATGKVKSYRLSAGTSGMFGEFTIGCTIGTAEAASAQPGVNSYVDDGYASPPWQSVTGAQTMLETADFSYQTLDDFVIDDDGLDLNAVTAASAVNECIVTNGLKTQLPLLGAFNNSVSPTSGSPTQTMRTITTTVTLDLKPVQGAEFHTDFFPALSQLALPKTIDLAAEGSRAHAA